MIEYEELEKEFLGIDAENHDKLIEFYNRYQDYFQQLNFINSEKTQKELWMLTDISDSFVEKLLQDGIKLSDFTINLFREYRRKFDVSLNKDKYYNSLIFSSGIRNLKKKKYYLSMILFKELKEMNPENNVHSDLFKESRFFFVKRISYLIGIIGFLLYITAFVLIYFFKLEGQIIIAKFFGDFCIFTFILTIFINKKPKFKELETK